MLKTYLWHNDMESGIFTFQIIVLHPYILGFVMEFPKGEIINVYAINSMSRKIHGLIY